MPPVNQALKSGLPAITKPSLSAIKTGGSNLPPRINLNAEQGWGKTSLAAQFKAPVFIQSKGEDGVDTLISSGLLKPTPHMPPCQNSSELYGVLLALIEDEHSYKTAVIDTVNGVERLLAELVCEREFDGNWTEYAAYGRGVDATKPEITYFLSLLERLRIERGMTIILLGHSKVQTVKNPGGSDYDRHQLDAPPQLAAILDRWCDAILYGGFQMYAKYLKKKDAGDVTKKAKMIGGEDRILYAQPSAAYIAKNRLGLPAEIDCGDSPEEAFKALATELMAGRNRAKEAQQEAA